MDLLELCFSLIFNCLDPGKQAIMVSSLLLQWWHLLEIAHAVLVTIGILLLVWSWWRHALRYPLVHLGRCRTTSEAEALTHWHSVLVLTLLR